MTEMSEKKLPDPLYSCAECYEEHSWPAGDLFWSEPLQDWFCDLCWDMPDEHWRGDETIDRGISLADELKRRGLNR